VLPENMRLFTNEIKSFLRRFNIHAAADDDDDADMLIKESERRKKFSFRTPSEEDYAKSIFLFLHIR
jgi:hypothetical protein